MADFAVLLPSAEGKAQGGNPLAPDMFDYRASNTFNYFHDLNPERRQLIDALQMRLKDASDEEVEDFFGVKGDTAREAVDADLGIYDSPLLAAIDRYGPGVMYRAMDFAELPTGAQRRLLENGVIFSGLFGLLRPDDLIPNYRLKMDASLPEIGRVTKFWREPLSQALNQALKGKFVWNLLPQLHREAWDDAGTYRAMYDVKFFRREGGELKALSHGVKPLRGAFVNFVVRDPADSVEAIEEWGGPEGYAFDPTLTQFDAETRRGEIAFVAR